jgi:hypothetical protein
MNAHKANKTPSVTFKSDTERSHSVINENRKISATNNMAPKMI